MKNVLTILLLLVVACAAQKPPAKQTHGFHWDWQKPEDFGSQTIATSKHISEAERATLLNAVAALLKDDTEAMKLAAETRVKFVDLNGGGVPEVIGQPVGEHICSPTGNCPFWVFQKTATGYRLIAEKGAVQTFTIQQTRTNGFFDLVLGMHGSATEQGLYVYRFRDGRYRRTDCYDANWTYLGKDGEVHDLEEPRITPCKK
jgi:hypothetical protein